MVSGSEWAVAACVVGGRNIITGGNPVYGIGGFEYGSSRWLPWPSRVSREHGEGVVVGIAGRQAG